MATVLEFTTLKYKSPEYYRQHCDIAIKLLRVLDKIKIGVPTKTYMTTDFIEVRTNVKRLLSFMNKIFEESGAADETKKDLRDKTESLINLLYAKEKNSVIHAIEMKNTTAITFYLADIYDFIDSFYDVLNQTDISMLKQHQKEFTEIYSRMMHTYPKFKEEDGKDKKKVEVEGI